jgi:hypothetical protein
MANRLRSLTYYHLYNKRILVFGNSLYILHYLSNMNSFFRIVITLIGAVLLLLLGIPLLMSFLYAVGEGTSSDNRVGLIAITLLCVVGVAGIIALLSNINKSKK